MSYMSLGMITSPVLLPGETEVKAFVTSVSSALRGTRGYPGGDVLWPGMCTTASGDQMLAYIKKWNDLKMLYPAAAAKYPMNCFASTTGTDRKQNAVPLQTYYDQFISTHTVNIDMTPATNTVASGTPGSWNVSGTQKSGVLYGYNFADQATAQNYAQAVVDSGGTATMYQVPASAATAMPAPVTGGAVGSGQYQAKGTVATGDSVDRFFPDLTSARNFVSTVNSAGGHVVLIDTSTGQTIAVESMAAPVYSSPAPSSGVYIPPPAPQYYSGSSPVQTPDQIYTSPAPVEAVPQEQASSGPSMTGMALLLAVPAAAWLYFKHR